MDNDQDEEVVHYPMSWRPSGSPYYLFWTKSCRFKFVILDNEVSKQRLEVIIANYGGVVCQDVVHPSAIVLVPENTKPLPTWGPVFSRNWIKDCITSTSLKELNDYLIKGCEKISLLEYNGSLTTSLFFDKYQFRSSFLHIAFFTKTPPRTSVKFDDNFRILCHKCHVAIDKASESITNDDTNLCEGSILKDSNKQNISGRESETQVQLSSPKISSSNEGITDKNSTKLIPKKRRLPFHESFNTNDLFVNKSNIIEGDKPGPSHVNQDEPKEINDLQDRNKQRSIEPYQVVEVEMREPDRHSAKKVPDPLIENTNNVKSTELQLKNNTTQLNIDKNKSTAPPVTVPSDPDSDDGIAEWSSLQKFRITNKHTKHRFTREEKEAMLKFIIRKRAFCRLKSDALYREMEERNVCPKRTYQSMKNHFLKNLIYELDTFCFLNDNLKMKLRGENAVIKN